jgi:hypothetical protein
MPVRFPSLEFFTALQQRTKDDRGVFEKLGYCDTRFGTRIGDALYRVTFEVYECVEVAEGGDSRQLDFVLAAPAALWTEMIESIRTHGGAGIDHSLNTLTHLGEVMRVEYQDPEGHDKFYRYMATIQEFFNQARHLDVVVR